MAQPDYLLGVVLKYGIVPAAVSTVGAYQIWRTRRHVRADASALANWAAARGWRVGDPNDPSVIEELSAMSALLAEEGERETGVVIFGQNAGGKIIVAETFRSDQAQASSSERGPSVDISFSASNVGPPAMCRVTQGGWLVRSKVVPFLDGPSPTSAQVDVLRRLPGRSRVRVMKDRVLLRRPGYLTPHDAEQLLDRLQDLADAHRSPGAGPHR